MGLLTAALLLAALTTPISASCAHGTNLHPRSDVFVPPRYDYAGTTGPLNWHHLDPAWATCAEGTMQSPILLNTTTATQRRALKTVVPLDQEPVLENLGTTVEIILEGQLSALNKMWDLKQCHFHTPSEHRLEGEHYEAEMHCVHTRVDDPSRVLVLGFFISVSTSRPTSFIEHFLAKLSEISEPGDKASTGPLPLSLSAFSSHVDASRYYRYTGSLTTPPCTEGINWFVATKPLKLSVATYHRLKDLTKMNSRFTQNRLSEPNLIEVATSDE